MSYPNVNASGVQFVREHLSGFPRPDHQAAAAIRAWGAERGQALDPEQVEVITLHYRPDGPLGYLACITDRLTLTQAVLSNWQGETDLNLAGALFGGPWAGSFPNGPVKIVDTLPAPGLWHQGPAYQVFNGLFRTQHPGRYDTTNHLQLAAEQFQKFIWDLDLHSHYKAMLDTYWAGHFDSHRLSCKIAFIAACNKQVQEGSLSDAGRALVWQAAGLATPQTGVRTCALNIYGYTATDLLCITDTRSQFTVLYLPGNSSPLHSFANLDAMRDWFAEQCRDVHKRSALKQYFAQADVPDGLDFSGLDTALSGLGAYPAIHHRSAQRSGFTTDGPWTPREYVHYRPEHYSPPITGDLFHYLAQRQRTRSHEDADFIITSRSQVTKARWRGYLNSAISLLAPLAIVVPELLPILAVGGVAQFGLGLDQAINGKSAQAQAEGVETLAYGLFNAAPLALEGIAKGMMYRVKSENFVFPSRLNEQWGYPLSPYPAPRFPEAEVAPYFHIPDDIAPLPGADELTAGSVIRSPRYDGQPDRLTACIDTYTVEVIYDLEHDVFYIAQDSNEVSPVGYIARTGSRDLRPAPPGRVVDNGMRSNTLRALGIDLALPVELPLIPGEGSLPIPKTLSSLWVGDKVISPDLISNLARNASQVKHSGYAYRLFLSNAFPEVFDENMRMLALQAPDLQVLPLEDQPFYQAFRQSKYHAQYQAAMDGNGGVATNFASATDGLRFFMLDHDGGLYMDVDDTILALGEHPQVVDGKALGRAGEAIDQVPLLAPPDGLLLAPPMSNEKMGMNCLYNTSLIGSHPNNPTLKAILEEMHARFQATPDFYDSKPTLASDPQGFYRYAGELSRMTGPRLLTDMVDQRLPLLYRLRQMYNLSCLPKVNIWRYVDPEAGEQATLVFLPLNRFAKVGGSHSWART
ncbi:dermonecrotic toxin domain-containing protein [Pseudomonas putida]